MSDFRPPELYYIEFVLSKPTTFMVICYSNSRKQIAEIQRCTEVVAIWGQELMVIECVG